ncbi:MAG: phosphoribosylglycinamide formyltransferase [Candidatus Omnitrophica bacterium]|nr:phosphoribosylglycinamide formyltransferase [Candidatus Omnitrophota bacterium]
MKNCAVFCSGFGSNLQALIAAVNRGRIPARIALVVSDCVDAYALVRAKKAGIPILAVDRSEFKTREDYDAYIIRRLKKQAIDYVILAGYMRIIGPRFVSCYKNKIVNIHPALLPSFKGVHGIKDALAYGVKITGVTVHFVDAELDAGPIILQGAVAVKADDTEDSLARRIHRLEHRLYPEAVRLLVQNKLSVKGRNVLIRR